MNHVSPTSGQYSGSSPAGEVHSRAVHQDNLACKSRRKWDKTAIRRGIWKWSVERSIAGFLQSVTLTGTAQLQFFMVLFRWSAPSLTRRKPWVFKEESKIFSFLNFQAFKQRNDVTLRCLCEPSEGQDGLIPPLTHPRENTNWQQCFQREKQRRRSEVKFHYWNRIPSWYRNSESHHLPTVMLFPSPFVSFLTFTSLFLRRVLTDTAVQAWAQRSPYCQKRGGGERQMSSWKNGNEMRKGRRKISASVLHLCASFAFFF